MTPETSSAPRTAADLRRAFVEFFAARDHSVVPSSPLVPNDPTLLFTNAGMVQFKPYFSAGDDVPYTRAVSVQKCLRLTDLERVGSTPRHDTFFEMLGNFSFGPKEKGAYFKEQAIAFAWEFTTGVLGLPKDRLYASIFDGEGGLPRDDEAAALWKKMGLPENRIVPLGRADNFWGPAGGQGACGPCSEIYFDLGEKRPDYLADGAFWGERPGDPGDRYMEFWNLVFPQFDAAADGALKPLPRPGIDTGMGIERLALIVQGVPTIFDTDLFEPLVSAVLSHRKRRERPTAGEIRDARIVADHLRALTFAIAEGALPGNEGAGYVLRRLLRRAVVRLRSKQGLAIQEPMLPLLGHEIVRRFGDHYTELARHEPQVVQVLEREEAAFAETYEAGLKRLEDLLGRGAIAGADAFALHDTYGFPLELTEEIAAERGVAVDRTGFDRAMEEQRTRARASSKFTKTKSAAGQPWIEVTTGPHSEFVGYDSFGVSNLALRRYRLPEAGAKPGTRQAARGGEEFIVDLVMDRTPFYPEGGGQVADRGTISWPNGSSQIEDVQREDEFIVHRAVVTDLDSLLAAGEKSSLEAHVSPGHRRPTMRHHTATHLLHAALRHVLGTHVQQAGSLVAPDRLRFDYRHFEAPPRDQLAAIEREVAEWVLRDREVRWQVMPIAEARAQGAMALFGEKYGSEVRMVTVDGAEEAGISTSRELCGGTHVSRTGEIGAFTIVEESAIASGVRRIEALCGHEALGHFKREAETLARASATLQASPAQLVDQIEKLKFELEKLRKDQQASKRGGLESEMTALVAKAETAPGGRWIVAELATESDAGAARDAADRLRGALGSGAAVLAIRNEGKLSFLAIVTDDLVAAKKLRADELVRAVAQVTGGSGGGKPHLALAGAKDLAQLADALEEARRRLREALQ